MMRDIFSDYIKKQIVPPTDPEVRCERTEGSSDVKALLLSQEAINLLKEISRKLDGTHLGAEDNKQPTARGSVQTAAVDSIQLAVINGKVVLPDNGIVETNVYIKKGKVHSLGESIHLPVEKVVDAKGRYVLPGIIDPHVHLGLFAPMAEELASETSSALVGGITTMGCYFGGAQSHCASFPGISEEIEQHAYTDIIPHLVISTDEQRKEIRDYIDHLGITSFKVYLNGIPGLIKDVDDGFILDVFEEIRQSNHNCILCAHAENRDIVRRANRMVKENKGDRATIQDWMETHPDMAEEEAVIRLSFLAEKSRVPTYFVHISSKHAMEKLRKIKQVNKYITVETTSPYLSLTREEADSRYIKMEPPFREAEDVEGLWEGMADGTVDTVGTDHVTLTKEEKNIENTIWDALPGYPALETHLAVLLNEGVVKRGIPLERLVRMMTKKPAEVFGVYPQKGTLLPGSDGDLVIVNLDLVKEVRAEESSSRSDFSLYEGKRLKGWPVMTIKSGEIVAENGKIVTRRHGGGKYLART